MGILLIGKIRNLRKSRKTETFGVYWEKEKRNWIKRIGINRFFWKGEKNVLIITLIERKRVLVEFGWN